MEDVSDENDSEGSVHGFTSRQKILEFKEVKGKVGQKMLVVSNPTSRCKRKEREWAEERSCESSGILKNVDWSKKQHYKRK